MKDKLKKEIVKIIKELKIGKNKIFLEPYLYEKSLKKFNVFKANYSKQMYDNITVAYIKPGLGTIEECLRRGIPLICYTKNTMKEFKYNSTMLFFRWLFNMFFLIYFNGIL